MTDVSPDVQSFRSNAVLYVTYGILIIMMACLAYVLQQLVRWVVPQSLFGYLLPFSIFVILEAVISTHRLFEEDDFSIHRLSYRFVEWIVLIVLTKILSYIPIGFGQLAVDLLEWEKNFTSFFTIEFIVGLIFIVLIWILTSRMTDRLLQLFSSREQLDIEREGLSPIDRQKLRRGFGSLIFITGGFMLAILTLIEINPDVFTDNNRTVEIPFGVVLLFFIGGFILLSQTQLFILWTRWYKHQIPSQPGIWMRWIALSILIITIAALAAEMLPTEYSMGLLQTLQTLFSYVWFFLAQLLYLLFTPFVLLLNSIAKLMDQQAAGIENPVNPPLLPTMPRGEAFTQPVWIDLLRSIFFWTVFLSIIFFAFRHYFHQNKEVVEVLSRQPYLNWLLKFINWIKSFYKRTKSWTGEVITQTQRRLRKNHIEITHRLPAMSLVRAKLPPRQKVRWIYLMMTEWIAARGFPRLDYQTPSEFAAQIIASFPEAAIEIDNITASFISARYSLAPISAEQAKSVHRSWKKLQAALSETIEDCKPN